MITFLDNLEWLALAFLIIIILLAGFVFYLATKPLGRSSQSPMSEDDQDAPIWSNLPVAEHVQTAEADITRFEGAFPKSGRPPVIALVGAPGVSTTQIAKAASKGAPAELGINLLRSLNVETIIGPLGIVIDFGNNLLTRNDWLETWRNAMQGLKKSRTERPLDAVVIAIRRDITEELGRERTDKIEALGERFGALLKEVQSIGGYRLPVYLLLTDTDNDPAFHSLSDLAHKMKEALPAIGWSSPHHPDEPFDPNWVDQAISEIADSANFLVLAGLAHADRLVETNQTSHLLRAVDRVGELASPLKLFLGAMLRTNAYADSMIFRGLYLTGGTVEDNIEIALFTEMIFAAKIFPEARLARPSIGRLEHEKRRVLRLKITAAAFVTVGGICLTLIWTNQYDKPNLLGLLTVIEQEVRAVRHLSRNGQTVATNHLSESTAAIYREMRRLDLSGVDTILVPTSYLSSVEKHVESAITISFDEVILPAIISSFKDEIELTLRPPHGIGDVPMTVSQIGTFSTNLSHIDQKLQVLNNLQTSSRAADLADLSKFTLHIFPPKEYDEHFQFYRKALRRTAPLSIHNLSFRRSLDDRLGPDGAGVFGDVFSTTPLYKALNDISVHEVWLTGQHDYQSDKVIDGLQRFIEAVAWAEESLADPSENWLVDNKSTVEENLRQAATRLGTLTFASDDLISRLRNTIDTELDASRKLVLSLGGAGERKIIKRGPKGLRLNPLYSDLRTKFSSLINKGVIGPVGSSSYQNEIVTQQRFSWNIIPLREALSIANLLRSEITDSFDNIPSELVPTLRSIAIARAQIQIVSLIDDAWSPVSTTDGVFVEAKKAEAKSFALAAPYLATLRAQVTILNLDEARRRIDITAGVQARRILAETDQFLKNSNIYKAGYAGFDIWDGQAQSAGLIFGANNTAELADTLRQWRGFLQRLINVLAVPVINYLSSEPGDSVREDIGLTEKWRRLITILEEYSVQKPGNSLAALEKFILLTMNGDTETACGKFANEAQLSGDFFISRLLSLERQLQGRCKALFEAELYKRYASLEATFNTLLAGKHPFSGGDLGSVLRLVSQTGNAAELGKIRQFFSAYGDEIDALVKKGGGFGIGEATLAGRVKRFLSDLNEVEKFLSGGVGEINPEGPIFAVSVIFRTNAAFERAGDQIVEMSLEFGSQRLSSFDAPRELVWRYGDPVILALRWARNAPNKPGIVNRPDTSVDDRIVRVAYDDPWALLSLIMANSPTSELRGKPHDLNPNVIEISVPLVVNSEKALSGQVAEGDARIFLRIELRSLDETGKKALNPALKLPFFPSAGPKP